MKNETNYVKKLVALLKKVVPSGKFEPEPTPDPVTQLVIGFLEWNATAKEAVAAHAKLVAVMVDNNDLRVSLPHEVVTIIGTDYPHADERATRMHEAMNEIYLREHAVTMDHLAGKPKKHVRTYLDTLPGMTPYVAAQVTLLNFGGHAIPIDDHMLILLKEQDAVDPEATMEEASAFIERQVKAGDGHQVHVALKAWADQHKLRTAAVPSSGGAATKTTKRTTKKSTKKTTKKPTKRAKKK